MLSCAPGCVAGHFSRRGECASLSQVQLLLNAGADARAQTVVGERDKKSKSVTPLDLAKDADIREMLLAASSSPAAPAINDKDEV